MPRAYCAKSKVTVCVIVYELNCVIKSTMSLSALQPFMDSLMSEIQQLRSAIGAVQLDADSAGLASVMGPAESAGMLTPIELSNKVKADAMLGGQSIAEADMSAARANARRLMDDYAKSVSMAAVSETRTLIEVKYLQPVRSNAQTAFDRLAKLEQAARDLIDASVRLPSGLAKMNPIRKAAVNKYDVSTRFVVQVATRFAYCKAEVDKITTYIDQLFEEALNVGGSVDQKSLEESQETQKTLQREAEFQEGVLVDHFNSGQMGRRSEVRVQEVAFRFPDNIEEGRANEFMKWTVAALRQKVTEYWAIIAEVERACSDFDPTNNAFYKPPCLNDGYNKVDSRYRNQYAEQAKRLYEKLDAIISQSVMTKVKSTFSYGKDERSFSCPVGDGPSLVFAIVALYRPSNEAYREKIEMKVYTQANRIKDGVAPRVFVKDMRTLLLEILNLDIKVKWSLSGKRFVTLLSDKSNVFSQKLSKFSDLSAIANVDDCAVELDQAVSAVESACNDLEQGGVKVKISANNVTMEDRKSSSNDKCHFGIDCYKSDCRFVHPPGWKRPTSTKKGKGKGGKGKGSKGKNDKNKWSTCQAKGCSQTCPYDFCKPCHRKGLECGSIVDKSGNKRQIGDRNSDKRVLQAIQQELEDLKEANASREVDMHANTTVFDRMPSRTKGAPISHLKRRAEKAQREYDDATLESKKARLQQELAECQEELSQQ